GSDPSRLNDATPPNRAVCANHARRSRPIHCAFSANHCRHSDHSPNCSDNNFTCSDNYFARLAHRCTRSAFHFACSVIHCTLSAFHFACSASHFTRLAFHFTRLVVHFACSVIHCTRLASRCTPSAERFRRPATPSPQIFLFLLVFLFATHGKRSNCIVTAQDAIHRVVVFFVRSDLWVVKSLIYREMHAIYVTTPLNCKSLVRDCTNLFLNCNTTRTRCANESRNRRSAPLHCTRKPGHCGAELARFIATLAHSTARHAH